MLKEPRWEWPKQSELQRSWKKALVSTYNGPSLCTQEFPSGENQFFSHKELRKEVFGQARNLRDAASHQDGLSETSFLQKSALKVILLAFMVRNRGQAIEIEGTMDAFLTSKTKYQALTLLRHACADRPIPEEQLGERRKQEALAIYLGDKQVYVLETRNQRSTAEDLANVSLEDISILAESDSNSVESDSTSAEDDRKDLSFSESALWEAAIE